MSALINVRRLKGCGNAFNNCQYCWQLLRGNGGSVKMVYRGVTRIFKRGGHIVSNIIVMAFSPRNIVGCLLKKGLQRGDHGHPRTPLATPLDYALKAPSIRT